MMFTIIGIIILFLIIAKAKTEGSSNMPPANVSRSSNGIEGHYDFLVAHGFISPEENEQRLANEREMREHPERFTWRSWDEFGKSIEQARQPESPPKESEK